MLGVVPIGITIRMAIGRRWMTIGQWRMTIAIAHFLLLCATTVGCHNLKSTKFSIWKFYTCSLSSLSLFSIILLLLLLRLSRCQPSGCLSQMWGYGVGLQTNSEMKWKDQNQFKMGQMLQESNDLQNPIENANKWISLKCKKQVKIFCFFSVNDRFVERLLQMNIWLGMFLWSTRNAAIEAPLAKIVNNTFCGGWFSTKKTQFWDFPINSWYFLLSAIPPYFHNQMTRTFQLKLAAIRSECAVAVALLLFDRICCTKIPFQFVFSVFLRSHTVR